MLGAGASAPLGFPLGARLRQDIYTDLGRTRGRIRQLLFAANVADQHVETFKEVLGQSQLPSVDLLLEKRPEFLEVGKLAMAAALVPLEQETAFAPDRPGAEWLRYLFKELVSGADASTFSENALSIVTFNYDRSVEHFLVKAVENTYGITRSKATEAVGRFAIVHVHGALGAYPGLGEGARAYAPTDNVAEIRGCAAAIRVLHEASSDPVLERAQALCRSAELVAFLGCGYHQANVQRLNPGEWPLTTSVLGSCYGLTPEEQRRARALFGRPVLLGSEAVDTLGFLRSYPVLGP